MTQLADTVIRKLASPRRPRFRTRPGFLAALVFRLACAGLLVWVGAVHLHLWSEGYREIPTIGPLFLADAVGGFVLAALLLVWPSPLTGRLGAGFMVSTLAGLILSINVGLFGFQESLEASFVTESILLESIGAAPSSPGRASPRRLQPRHQRKTGHPPRHAWSTIQPAVAVEPKGVTDRPIEGPRGGANRAERDERRHHETTSPWAARLKAEFTRPTWEKA